MAPFIRFYFYRFLSLLFYYLGDFLCRLPTYTSFRLYQFSMQQSLKFDEKVGFVIWKEPK